MSFYSYGFQQVFNKVNMLLIMNNLRDKSDVNKIGQ